MMLLAIQHSLDECDDVYCRSIIKNLVHVFWGHHTKGLKQVDVVKTTRFFALFDVKRHLNRDNRKTNTVLNICDKFRM